MGRSISVGDSLPFVSADRIISRPNKPRLPLAAGATSVAVMKTMMQPAAGARYFARYFTRWYGPAA